MRGRVRVALFAVAVHLTAIGAGFTWLDHGDLVEGAAIAPPPGWLGLFTHGFARTGFYRPLVALSLSIDALARAPSVFHLDSLVWHALAAVLVVRLAVRLGLSSRVAEGCGLLFAVHPVTALVAYQVSLRVESMTTVALLALLIAHLDRRPWPALVAMLAGGLCKESALVLGPALVVLVSWSTRRWPVRPLLAEAAGLALAGALHALFAPTWHASSPALTVNQALGVRLTALAKGVAAVVVPWPHRLCDAVRVEPWFAPVPLLGLLALVALAALAIWRRGAAALLFASIAPLLSPIPLPRFFSLHYLYLPLCFAVMVVAEAGIGLVRASPSVSRILKATAVAIGLLAAGASFALGFRYRDDGALFEPEATGHPECREAHLYLGDWLRDSGKLDEAAAAYQVAAAPAQGYVAYSDELAALQNLGLVRLTQKNFFEAELAFEEAEGHARTELDRRTLEHNLAAVAVERGDPEDAIRRLSPELSRPDPLPESLYLLARALHEVGRDDESRQLLHRLGIQPN